jgi:hypothetical protein
MKNLKLILVVVIFALLSNANVKAQFVEVDFVETPTATFASHNNIRIINGDSIELIIELTGENDNGWTLIYSDGDKKYEKTITKNPYKLMVSPNQTTIYTLISVSNDSCDGTIIRSRKGVIVSQ